MAKSARDHLPSALRSLLASESAGGLILMASAAAALAVANSPWGDAYFSALHIYIAGLSVLHWINDCLMAVFFLLVGLEIKRELLDGQLKTWPHRILPGAAAFGGMAVPALIYVAVNIASPETLRGWAIPAATDIAFSLGILALLGPRAPVSLKIFLTALAIIDDLGAIIIIGAFYTDNLSPVYVGAALLVLIVLFGMNRAGITRLFPYLALGALMWFFALKSGGHATVAGVALAFTIPIRKSPGRPDDAASPLHALEHALQPWVAFGILPIFGFANAGMSLSGLTFAHLLDPVTLGCILGLVAGKQLGVFGAAVLTIRMGLAQRPRGANWAQIYGVAILCGIGFTMSLFIGSLAFGDFPQYQGETKIGVLVASFFSAGLGWLVLRVAPSAKT
jgi:NhaA family Na+:H+ antiporter